MSLERILLAKEIQLTQETIERYDREIDDAKDKYERLLFGRKHYAKRLELYAKWMEEIK